MLLKCFYLEHNMLVFSFRTLHVSYLNYVESRWQHQILPWKKQRLLIKEIEPLAANNANPFITPTYPILGIMESF